ncbi:MAG: sulfur carrier protein ThiS [Hyphomicrobiaceae bacterium]|nr:sulfur carrier protein ThiS [Hyphomicrobiaceae bacterium]
MNIRLNGAPAQTGAKTLKELLAMLGYHEDAKIATAVNGDFVPSTGRAEQKLANNDEIEIVAPRQGG